MSLYQEPKFGVSEILIARHRLMNKILRTPLIHSPALSKKTGCDLYLKMECWQLTGSFKVRGALNMVSAITEEERNRGLITASSGNHGIALSYSASILGNPPTKVFVPKNADTNKIEKIRSFGAEAILHGENFTEALDEALRYVEKINGTYVHSHSHPLVIAGQGTIGLEVMEDLPDAQKIIVPIGGGGLISGISTAVKSLSKKTEIIGIEPTAAPGAYLSLRDGHCHERIELRQSVADGLLGTFTQLTFDISKDLIESVKLVEEDQIIHAMKVFQQEEQLMIEGSAAVGLAAILNNKIDVKNQKVVLVLTGRNIDSKKYNELINSNNLT